VQNVKSQRSGRLGLPNLGLGVGLRNQHFSYLMRNDPQVDWFEIISENFMDNFGYARHVLERLAAIRPIVMHGVSLSVGSTDPLNWDYLKELKTLAEFVQPKWISDHLCWTGVANVNTHDLLPLPLTEESLSHVAERVGQIQDFLQRPLILENPSTYLEFKESTMTEWEFLTALAETADCGLLLDVNNVFVSARNHGFDPSAFLDGVPRGRVGQFHLAGHSDKGTHLLDTHDHPVCDDVWALYREAVRRTGARATLLERDDHIPSLDELCAEARRAADVAAEAAA